ncbi:MAG: cytochrome C assembly family protein, partial [Burkholderiales bacterium]
VQILLYLIVAASYAAVALTSKPEHAFQRHAILVPLALHAVLLYSSIATPAGFDLGVANSVSAIAWMTALMYWLGGLWYPLATLHRLVALLAAVCALFPLILPAGAPIPVSERFAFKIHLVIAILAYGLFTIAALQALLMTLMERRLHGHELTAGMHHMPPLLTMEKFLFQIIAAGFLLLTLTLLSGMVFSEELFGRPLAFTHKVVFAIVSWLIFAVLLAGRFVYGWRGKTALRWVLAGFVALVLAYLGSKFVLEIILRQ